MGFNDDILKQLEAKFWDFPTRPDEMRVISYDVNDNPTQIDYYFSNNIVFTHELEYDGSGRVTKKKLIRR